ncbi:MAG: ribonuclease H-like domain-containing protein [Planctomycetota bacterium]
MNQSAYQDIVFDIETVGVPWEELPESVRQNLIRKAGDGGEDQARSMLGLSPATGKIVAIAYFDVQRGKGRVFYESNDPSAAEESEHFVPGNERFLLEKFYEIIGQYRRYITYNGKYFDVPFLLARSAVHRIVPRPYPVTRRFSLFPHLDLCELMSSFGAVRFATLDAWCHTFGVKSPKDGIDGSQVQGVYESGGIRDIASYCLEDVRATAELFERTEPFLLAPRDDAHR